MYIRFETYEKNGEADSCLGVFHAAYILLRSGKLESHEFDSLLESLNWFEKNLVVPKVLDESGKQRAISWFQPTAHEPIQRVRHIVTLLEEHEVPIRMVKTLEPGMIVHEDEWQVVAVPPGRKTRKR